MTKSEWYEWCAKKLTTLPHPKAALMTGLASVPLFHLCDAWEAAGSMRPGIASSLRSSIRQLSVDTGQGRSTVSERRIADIETLAANIPSVDDAGPDVMLVRSIRYAMESLVLAWDFSSSRSLDSGLDAIEQSFLALQANETSRMIGSSAGSLDPSHRMLVWESAPLAAARNRLIRIAAALGREGAEQRETEEILEYWLYH